MRLLELKVTHSRIFIGVVSDFYLVLVFNFMNLFLSIGFLIFMFVFCIFHLRASSVFNGSLRVQYKKHELRPTCIEVVHVNEETETLTEL